MSKMNQLPQVDYRCDVNYFVYFVSPTKQVVDQVADSVRYVYARIYSPYMVKILSVDLEGNLDTLTSPMYGPCLGSMYVSPMYIYTCVYYDIAYVNTYSHVCMCRSLHAANHDRKVKVALYFIPRQQKMVDLLLTVSNSLTMGIVCLCTVL